jgi:hypothetical protein
MVDSLHLLFASIAASFVFNSIVAGFKYNRLLHHSSDVVLQSAALLQASIPVNCCPNVLTFQTRQLAGKGNHAAVAWCAARIRP